MPIFKHLFQYNQNQSGWEEVFYNSDTTIDNAQQYRLQLLQRLLFIRAYPTVLYGIRVSQIDQPRNAQFRLYNITSEQALTQHDAPAPASTAGEVRLTGAQRHKRLIWVRGVRHNNVQRFSNGQDVAGGDFNQQMQAIFNALRSNNFGTLYRKVPPDGGAVFERVNKVEVSPLAPNLAKLSLNAPSALTAGMQIRCYGVPHDDLPGFPNVATIVATDGTGTGSITVDYRVRAAGPVTPTKMKFCRQLLDLDSFDSWQFQRWGEHTTGRPFGSLAGRSRAKVRRQ